MCAGTKEMPSIGGKRENDEKAHRNHIRTITHCSVSGREHGAYNPGNGRRDRGDIYI